MLREPRSRAAVAVLLAAQLTAAGCRSQFATDSLDQLKCADRTNMAIGGAILGALLGGTLALLAGGDDVRNALIGAAIGASAGAITGDMLGKAAAERRQEFADDAAYLDAETARVQEAVQVQSELNAKMEARIGALRQEKETLLADVQAGRTRKDEAEDLVLKYAAMEKDTADRKVHFDNAIGYLKEAEQQVVDSPELADRKEKLRADIGALEQKKKEVERLNEILLTEREEVVRAAQMAKN
jgi:hypothetical protein